MTRLEEERFLIITGAGFGMHDLAWIRSQLSGREGVELNPPGAEGDVRHRRPG